MQHSTPLMSHPTICVASSSPAFPHPHNVRFIFPAHTEATVASYYPAPIFPIFCRGFYLIHHGRVWGAEWRGPAGKQWRLSGQREGDGGCVGREGQGDGGEC